MTSWYHFMYMNEPTIFSQIIDRAIPAHFVYEDDICVVIMDAFPSVPGQVLVIPREPVDYLFDLPDSIYQHVFSIAKRIAVALDDTFDVSRTCLVVEGYEVPHTHIKIYPMPVNVTALDEVIVNTTPADPDELAAHCKMIKAAL